MKRTELERLLADRAAQRPVALATALDNAESQRIDPRAEIDSETPPELLEVARRAVRLDRAETCEVGGREWLVNPYNPPQRMALVGAVHIAQALAPMAAQAGFEVTVIDPRRAFATEARFPDVHLDPRWPDEAFAERAPDTRTAVVTLTHDPKIDDPALAAALESDAFYIGALGSRRTHAARRERLAERGFDESATGRIHAPVGLDLGGRAPAEIAVSVLAEAIGVLRRGS